MFFTLPFYQMTSLVEIQILMIVDMLSSFFDADHQILYNVYKCSILHLGF